MKGLRLYVRPIEAADAEAIQRFRSTATPPACGLLGKLLGDLVAVVDLEITTDALRVNDVFVAQELRRKWIGRAMMREVEQLAAKLDRRRIIVDDARGAQEFFRRVGFESEGDRWVRVVT
ncbi:MAG TPA: GNAT family N-acetyltransferase [Thermoanaerobaculia bacterium]|nr:GNAT family N-acetyltransferase [Thermoanaerobaculia bacterium]